MKAATVGSLQPLQRDLDRELYQLFRKIVGGVLSLLLANFALHGLETVVIEAFPTSKKRRRPPIVVRYADDFVVLHEDRKVIEESQQIVAALLGQMGLELKPTKTRISHTPSASDGEPGLDFLGFHARQYPVGEARTAHTRTGEPLGFKT